MTRSCAPAPLSFPILFSRRGCTQPNRTKRSPSGSRSRAASHRLISTSTTPAPGIQTEILASPSSIWGGNLPWLREPRGAAAVTPPRTFFRETRRPERPVTTPAFLASPRADCRAATCLERPERVRHLRQAILFTTYKMGKVTAGERYRSARPEGAMACYGTVHHGTETSEVQKDAQK